MPWVADACVGQVAFHRDSSQLPKPVFCTTPSSRISGGRCGGMGGHSVQKEAGMSQNGFRRNQPGK